MITAADGALRVSGPLNLDNLCAVLSESRPHFARRDWIVDLSGITDVDSTALSLLFEWQREAAPLPQ